MSRQKAASAAEGPGSSCNDYGINGACRPWQSSSAGSSCGACSSPQDARRKRQKAPGPPLAPSASELKGHSSGPGERSGSTSRFWVRRESCFTLRPSRSGPGSPWPSCRRSRRGSRPRRPCRWSRPACRVGSRAGQDDQSGEIDPGQVLEDRPGLGRAEDDRRMARLDQRGDRRGDGPDQAPGDLEPKSRGGSGVVETADHPEPGIERPGQRRDPEPAVGIEVLLGDPPRQALGELARSGRRCPWSAPHAQRASPESSPGRGRSPARGASLARPAGPRPRGAGRAPPRPPGPATWPGPGRGTARPARESSAHRHDRARSRRSGRRRRRKPRRPGSRPARRPPCRRRGSRRRAGPSPGRGRRGRRASPPVRRAGTARSRPA